MTLRRLSLGAATALALALPAPAAHASGVTTHAFMAEAAIPYVEDPTLRAILEAHPDEVITGGHFPDGGYAAGGYGEVTHWERFVNAYTKQLKGKAACAPLTSPTGPCAQQVAFLMGIAAHGIGDERWDWLFEPKLADFGESPVHPGYSTYSEAGLPGAAELMGLPPGSLINTPEFALDNIALVEFDRLRKVPMYQPPYADLLATYGALGREDVTMSGIMQGHAAILAAAAGERAGAGSEYPRVKLTAPRVSALYYTGTGGVLDVAQAAAGYYGAVWKKLTTDVHPAPVVTAVNPQPDQEGVPFDWHPVKAAPGPNGGGAETRIMASISQSLDVGTISAADFRLLGPDGAELAQEDGFPKPGPYGAGDGTHTLMLWPKEDLRPCTRYTAELRPGVKDYTGAGLRAPYRWSFTTRSADGAACPVRSDPPPTDPGTPPAQDPGTGAGPTTGPGTPQAEGPGSGGTTTLPGVAADPAVTAAPQTVSVPAGEPAALGLPATSVVGIRSLARVRGKGRTLRLLVSCLGPDACSGRLRLVARPGRGAARIGERPYAIPPLKTRTFTYTLSRRERARLARTKRLPLEARAFQDSVRGTPGAITARRFVLREIPPRQPARTSRLIRAVPPPAQRRLHEPLRRRGAARAERREARVGNADRGAGALVAVDADGQGARGVRLAGHGGPADVGRHEHPRRRGEGQLDDAVEAPVRRRGRRARADMAATDGRGPRTRSGRALSRCSPARRTPGVSDFPPGFFDRYDPSPDTVFYGPPRLVTHIDDGAIAAVGATYAELGIDGEVLDLMSSWVSHFQDPPRQLTVLGMNAAELGANEAAAERVVADLNADPALPFADASFDDAVCCVSVDYLTQPVAVMREVARVLRPGGRFVCTFSNRCFPTKAVRGWLAAEDHERPAIVQAYFAASGAFAPAEASRRPEATSDPLWAVWATRR